MFKVRKCLSLPCSMCARLSHSGRVHFTRVTTTYDFDDLMLNFVRTNALKRGARPLTRVCVGYSLKRSPVSLYSMLHIYSMYIKTHIPAAYITICIHNTATCAHTIYSTDCELIVSYSFRLLAALQYIGRMNEPKRESD